MSGYDSPGAAYAYGGSSAAPSSSATPNLANHAAGAAGSASTTAGPSAPASTGNGSGGGGAGTKRRRANADPDFYPGAAPTTKRAQANWKAAQEQLQSRNAALQQQEQQQQQQMQAHQQQHMRGDPDSHQSRQPILSLATLPPEALQRYLSRYGLIDPQGLLSYHHAVFPVPPLPETLVPPLEGRQLNVRKAKQSYIPAARNAKILAARGEAAQASGPAAYGPEGTGEGFDLQTSAATTEGSAAVGPSSATGTVAPASTSSGLQPPVSAVTTTPAGGTATLTTTPAAAADSARDRAALGPTRPWIEPKTPEFAGLSAFDDPDVVLARLAARATQHWDKRESLKEAETLTNFMFSVRNRGRTLRATPAG